MVVVRLVSELVLRASTARQEGLVSFTVFGMEGKLLQVVDLHQWAPSDASTNKFSPSPVKQSLKLHFIELHVEERQQERWGLTSAAAAGAHIAMRAQALRV